jgi:hypothetical protein
MESLPPEMVALVLAYAKPKIEMQLDITLFSNCFMIDTMDKADTEYFHSNTYISGYVIFIYRYKGMQLSSYKIMLRYDAPRGDYYGNHVQEAVSEEECFDYYMSHNFIARDTDSELIKENIGKINELKNKYIINWKKKELYNYRDDIVII